MGWVFLAGLFMLPHDPGLAFLTWIFGLMIVGIFKAF